MLQNHSIVWKPLEYQGIEYLTLWDDENALQVQSVVIGVEPRSAFRLDYSIRCDATLSVRETDLRIARKGKLHLTTDGQGNWFDSEHNPLHELNGCLDIDISATPFTNTLPIRRIAWQPGQSETLTMVYIAIPDLTVNIEPQRYTCIE